MSKITYYLVKSRRTDVPETIFRFFEEDRSPEHLGKNYNWVPDDTLLEVFGSGDLGDDDIISESEALRLIEEWCTQLDRQNKALDGG